MEEQEKNIIETEYQDVKNEIYFTAPQMAQKINDTDSRIRYWADSFGDLIGTERLNGRKQYKESDIYKFAFIKDLLDNKNFNHDQVRIYIAKHGFKYAEYNSGLVSEKDPLGFEALASALSVKNEAIINSKLNNFKEEILLGIAEKLEKTLIIQSEMNLENKAEIEASVDKIVSDKLDSKLSDFKSYINQKELDNKARDIELLDNLKRSMELNKQKSENEEKENKKGFWNWFKKK